MSSVKRNKKISLRREFSAITIMAEGNDIRLVFHGDKKLFKKLQKECRKRGIYFSFELSKCG